MDKDFNKFKRQSELSRFVEKVMGIASDPVRREEAKQKERYARNKKRRNETTKNDAGI